MYIVLRTILLVFTVVHCTTLSKAQRLHFQHYSVESGLANTIVYDALQDDEGFLWFGTESGLNRYDGTGFKTYTTADGLPANTILKVNKDRRGRLWLSCYNEGVAYLDKGKLYTSKNTPLLANLTFPTGAFNFLETSKYLYLFDSYKLYQLEATNNKIIKLQDFENANHGIKAMTNVGDSVYVITKTGIYTLENDLLNKIYTLDNATTNVKYASYKNYFFYASDNRLTTYKINNDDSISKQTPLVFKNKIEILRAINKGEIWVQIAYEGVFQILYDEKNFMPPKPYPGIKNINYTFRDKENTLWFTTADNGVFALSSDHNYLLTTDEGIPSNKILSIEKAGNGQVLVGDASNNLINIKNGQLSGIRQIKQSRQFNRLLDIKTEPLTGEIWVGTDEGFFVFDKNYRQIFHGQGSIKSICIGKKSAFIGVGNGYWDIDLKTKNKKILNNKEKIMAIAEDAQNKLWLGKLNGLEIWNNNNIISLGEKIPQLYKVRITGLTPTNDNMMWVATHQNGLLLLKNDTVVVRHITESDGLTSNICQNICIDEKGFIWASTNKGLNKINPQTYTITRFSTTNALLDNDVSDALVTGDTVWAATSKGIAIFKDDGYIPTSPDFKTVITGININGVTRPLSNKIEVPADSCDFFVQFAALSSRSNGQFLYNYSILRPMPDFRYVTWDDIAARIKEWQQGNKYTLEGTLQSNTMRMSNVEAGHYIFEVVAISYDGVRSKYPAEQEILIRPRLYQCIWFQVLCTALLVGFAIGYNRKRMKELRAESQLKQEITRLKLEAFKAQINPHFIFNSINGIQRFFFPPDPAKANEYIAIFSNLLRKTLDFSEKTNVPFEQELNYLKDYLELTRIRVGERFEYEILGSENIPAQSEIPAMLLQPLVENSIIHGFPPQNKAKLILRFSLEKNRLTCTIEDNGIGIKESLARRQANGDPHTPRGTKLVQNRIDILNHTMKINIKLRIQDKTDLQQGDSGTVAEVSFDMINPKNTQL